MVNDVIVFLDHSKVRIEVLRQYGDHRGWGASVVKKTTAIAVVGVQ